MRYVISDIHGEYDLFLKLLNKINFSSSDEMIVCGDIIDKGVDSIKLLKYVMTKDNIRCIIGNHEYYFLKYYLSLMQNSPEDFDFVLKKLMEHFPYDTDLLNWDVMDYLESLPYFIEEKDFICVHAGVE
ncbi:MAG: metallophosphoesterase, partial [Clostridia bacterium]|nr:metallophosphoesterase [Clostridia bacterium]